MSKKFAAIKAAQNNLNGRQNVECLKPYAAREADAECHIIWGIIDYR